MTARSASKAIANPTRDGLDTVAGRTVLVAVIAALVATLVAAGVSIPLIRSAAEEQARETLADLADVTAATLEDPRPGGITRLRDLLASQSTQAFIIAPDAPLPSGIPSEAVNRLLAGESVSQTLQIGNRTVFLEGRPLAGAAVVLLAPVDVTSAAASESVQRLAIALVIGLLVAVGVAIYAASRVTRPLRRVAVAAERLTAGERDVQVQPDGPAEVAEIADSINRLSSALSVSENRQREFLLSVSHELRTPLTAVSGFAEAIADGVVAHEDVPRTAGIMHSESQRLERLVADLLDLSRLGAADLQINTTEVDLVNLVRQAELVWSDRCRRDGVTFTTDICTPEVIVDTDPVRVRQIIDNLAENALRVTPEGGTIAVAVDVADEQAVLAVSDTGPGLAPGDAEVAFEPAVLYTRYQGIRPVGSGVGLALVGRLATRLGGTAAAGQSDLGGARFTVTLPATTTNT